MSQNLQVLIVLLASLSSIIIVIWMNIRFVMGLVRRWDSNATVLFIFSLGQFGQRQKERWKDLVGCNDNEANIIIKYQLLCLLECPLGFFISALASDKFLGR